MIDFKFEKPDFRYERKFVVPYLDKDEAELVIRSNSFFFNEIYYERQVNSLYFDTFDMDSYFDNVLGNTDRLKIRIRWYGDLMKITKPTLELKIRRGLVGTKLLFPLKEFSLPCSLKDIRNVFAQSELPPWLLETMKTQKFAILNSYTRKYFASACNRYRITLDSNLKYWGIFNQDHLSLMKYIEDDYVILELKYKIQEDAEDVTTQFPFRMTKSSKFVTAYNHFKGK